MSLRSRTLLTLALCGLLSAGLVLSGCSKKTAEQPAGDQAQQTDQTQTAEQSATPGGDGLYTPSYQPNGKEVAVIKTSKGVITVTLFGKDAPIHVGNFVELARKGIYDNTKFHRYEPGFVIQGGDPQSKDLTAKEVIAQVESQQTMLGTGGPGYTIKGEFDPQVNPNKHVKGALGMARAMSPDSAGSQFYFALDALPQLDGQYTVFGVVKSGMDVVEKLRVGDVIESVTIENAAK